MGAKKAIIENQYIDKDYMVDYSKFYARSFVNHIRFTKRIHFFSNYFSKENFFDGIKNNDENFINKLKKSYLGFIVIKPIRDKKGGRLIGKTLIKSFTRDHNNEFRKFIKNEHHANLCGIQLIINTLPFQRQDIAVGACATTALWISQHPLNNLFGIPVFSPIEITEKSVIYRSEFRNFPSTGLTFSQMINYIKSIGLDTEIIDVENIDLIHVENINFENFVSDVIKAYTNADLPIIATIKLLKKGKREDYHAVVICGFRYNTEKIISELYIHDDQIGPYSRVFSDDNFKIWKNEWIDIEGYDKVVLEKFIIPIYPKIRLTFGRIYQIYSQEKEMIKTYGLQCELLLFQINKYKTFLLGCVFKNKKEVLTSLFPRFIWVIRIHNKENVIVDYIYDGTSVPVKNISKIKFINDLL